MRIFGSKRRLGRLVSVIVALPLLLAAEGLAAVAAGFEGMLQFGGYHVGAFISSDGSRAYCLEPGADAPVSQQLQATRVSQLPAYSLAVSDAWGWSGTVHTSAASVEQMRQMNWLLTEHGDTVDSAKSAAVQIALWEIRREPGNAAWIDGKYALFRAHGGQRYIDAGVRLAQQARSEAKGPGWASPEGQLELAAGEQYGLGTVSYPAGTTELTITGGYFSDGATVLTVDDGGAGIAEWAATPNTPTWGRVHQVNISGTWAVAERFWPAELILHPSARETEQRIGAGVSAVAGENVGGFAPASLESDGRFVPVISTQVPEHRVMREEGLFSDAVTVGAAGAPWPNMGGSDGEEYLPLLANGTLYGPYDSPQAVGPHPPVNAPVAARSDLAIDSGPGTYPVTAAVLEPTAGYYYWVWEIRETNQTPEIRESELLAPGGVYADQFGVPEEEQFVATELRWETRLARNTITPDDRELLDRVRVSSLDGAWIRDESGERLPATLRLSFYQLDARPQRASTPPPEANELGSVLVTVSQPDVWVDAPVFSVPEGTRGWVTVRGCLLPEDQEERSRDRIAEWCDDFGVPDETAEMIVTLAESGSTGGDAARGAAAELTMLGCGLAGAGVLVAGIAALRRRVALEPQAM